MSTTRPPFLVSTALVILIAAGWISLRLAFFNNMVVPLTFVLPLLVCVWSRRRSHVWGMATAFLVAAIIKVFWILPEGHFGPRESFYYLAAILANIAVGSVVVHALITMRTRLERHYSIIFGQNAELDAQSEKLAQQNDEIRTQAEELAQQNEEIEAQNEELAGQNEDLVDLNTRLAGREEILQGLIHSLQTEQPLDATLTDLCGRALSIVGAPAASVALLERSGSLLHLQASASFGEAPAIPGEWPVAGSIADVVLQKGKTAYISDLAKRPELAAPFGPNGVYRSILAAPLPGKVPGFMVACSEEPGHWTDEQFRVFEWIAAKACLTIQALRSREALEEHAEALEEANQSKDRFLAMLSHELRTPLTPVLAAAGILEGDPRLPNDIREDMQMIRRNAGIQSKLIDDLLDLTRISRGKIELERQLMPAADLVRNAICIIDCDIDAKAQELRVDVGDIEDCAVLGDGARLQQVFWNLLKNAAKFSAPGAIIRVRGRRNGARIQLAVIDEGHGIRSDDLDRIFLPFEQAKDQVPQANGGGLGLGLAIAKAVVELHGGKITAHSDGTGKGSTFVVDLPFRALPVRDSDDSRTPSFRQPVAVRASSTPRILLVEDHRDTGKIIQRILQTCGYKVEHALTAGEGWKLFEEGTYDLVISDVGLPDENGIDLMRRMRAHKPETVAICLSGYGMEEDVENCHEAGFKEHLTKPIDFGYLQTVVAKYLPENRQAESKGLAG